MTPTLTRRLARWPLLLGPLFGCGDSTQPGTNSLDCSIPAEMIRTGAGRDAIPALTNPPLVTSGDAASNYLLPDDRVIGIVVEGQPIAVPLNVGWWHEVVNLDVGDSRLAVTHCPLTGSSLVFDRGVIDAADFGVSGLLYLNNLIMYDRRSPESLWPQMARGARCGAETGQSLTMLPSMEATWEGWLSLHPDTRVVSSETGIARDYRHNPYEAYQVEGNSELLYSIPFVDNRRPLKERVLGVPQGEDAGFAFPFGTLEQAGAAAAIPVTVDGAPSVVFWDSERQAAAMYRATLDGVTYSFAVTDGQIVDDQSGSTWRVDGLATDGPLADQRLEPVPTAYVSFWFGWAAFHPNTTLWDGGTL